MWAARVVARIDRRGQLALLPLGDEEAARLLGGVPEKARGECWWFVRRDGTPVPGDAGGGIEVLELLALTRPVARVLRPLGGSRLLDAFDKLVARYRGQLGKLVPEGPAPRRFP